MCDCPHGVGLEDGHLDIVAALHTHIEVEEGLVLLSVPGPILLGAQTAIGDRLGALQHGLLADPASLVHPKDGLVEILDLLLGADAARVL